MCTLRVSRAFWPITRLVLLLLCLLQKRLFCCLRYGHRVILCHGSCRSVARALPHICTLVLFLVVHLLLLFIPVLLRLLVLMLMLMLMMLIGHWGCIMLPLIFFYRVTVLGAVLSKNIRQIHAFIGAVVLHVEVLLLEVIASHHGNGGWRTHARHVLRIALPLCC